MLGPTSQVFYLDYVYASTKGSVTAGQRAFDSVQLGASNPSYSSDQINSEQSGTGNGSNASPALSNLAYLPVIPGSVVFQTSDTTPQVANDNGNGSILQNGVSVGTINYSSGAIAITWGTAPASGPILSTYNYDLEAQTGSAIEQSVDENLVNCWDFLKQVA